MKNILCKIYFRRLLCFILTAASLAAALSARVFAVTAPDVKKARAALIYCVEVDSVLWSLNPDVKIYPAATVKLMTAIVALEYYDGELDRSVTASANAINNTAGNHISLKKGETMTVRDLLYAMILVGANDAALVLAEDVAGSIGEFVTLMNKKAAELGMEKTVYTNPTGLHEDKMITTATDLLSLASYVSRNYTAMQMCGAKRYNAEATNLGAARRFINRNYLTNDLVSTDYFSSKATGMISGSTPEAGFCVIASAQQDGLNYIAIVMDAETNIVTVTPEQIVKDSKGKDTVVPAVTKTVYEGFIEAKKLIEWADKNFSYIKAVDTSTSVCEMKVRLAKNIDHVTLLPQSPVELFVPVDFDRSKDISFKWTLDSEELSAPVAAGQVVGTITVYYRGAAVGTVPLVVKTNIEQNGWLNFLDKAKQLSSTLLFKIIIFTVIFGAIIYVFAVSIIRYRKRAAAKRAYIKKNRML